jgi:hypothetical protein
MFDEDLEEFRAYNGEQTKKTKKDPIQWNENLEAVLAAQVFKRKAYIRTDQTAEVKWTLVKNDVSNHELFQDLATNMGIVLSVDQLKKKFERMAINARKTVDEEGENLSGLDCDNIATSVSLTLKMCKEIDNKKETTKEKKTKEFLRNKRMLAHEDVVNIYAFYFTNMYTAIFKRRYSTQSTKTQVEKRLL